MAVSLLKALPVYLLTELLFNDRYLDRSPRQFNSLYHGNWKISDIKLKSGLISTFCITENRKTVTKCETVLFPDPIMLTVLVPKSRKTGIITLPEAKV